MKQKQRIIGKLLAAIICTAGLIWLIGKDERVFQQKQPEGEGISISDAVILMEALKEELHPSEKDEQGEEEILEVLTNRRQEGEQELLLYRDYIALIWEYAQEDEGLKRELSYDDKYREDFLLLKEDWYRAYERLLAAYGVEDRIGVREIFLLAGNEGLKAPSLAEGQILSSEGTLYRYRSREFEQCYFRQVKAYVRAVQGEEGNGGKKAPAGELLTLVQKQKTDVTIPNLWIMEAEESGLLVFFSGYEMLCPFSEVQKEAREQVADLTFGEGGLKEIKLKTRRVNGKLLRITRKEAEIEGVGVLPIAPDCKGYQLYETLKERELSTLALGYDFTDFVVEEEEICAFLVMRREEMESIRVAIKTDDFKSLYHQELTLCSDCDMEISYGDYSEKKKEIIPAGEEISIDNNSSYLAGGRMEICPAIKSGKIQVLSLTRSQGAPAYRGKLEIASRQEGLLLINELLLEEYLYSVVPSEMPAGYPAEALKAQAVCARTYAYRYLLSPGLGDLGAHVDDSVSYQVYNNIAEHSNATQAVKETTGQLLCYEGEPASTYYYSTSWGFGTDAGIWKEENTHVMPYISARPVRAGTGNREEEELLAGKMAEEENFREYLLSPGEDDYERQEPWYRWEYRVGKLSVKDISERLRERYTADVSKVLTGDGEAYESREPEKIKEIYDISVLSRRPGGVIGELLLVTDAGIYKVISEYNVRYILSQGGSILRRDGSEVEAGQLLPSAYFMIALEKDGENVVGYKINGGGYGHGAGMSQNGARAMGEAGLCCEEILTFFFEGCQVQKRY